MALTVGQRIKLLTEANQRLLNQVHRMSAEIESIIREISVDISDEPEYDPNS